MTDQPDTSPPPERAPVPERSGSRPPEERVDPEVKHRHRGVVWSLIVLASVVLVVSMTANWVQTQVLHTNTLADQTSEILKNQDVQQQLSIFAVNQLFADVDVQGQIQAKLPDSAQALAIPITAATRQLATNAAEKALATPQVQDLVSTAVGRAQQRFVSLIDNKGQYVSTTGGDVTFEYGAVIADLAARLGIDPATISKIQGLVQEYTTNLRDGLTQAQTQIQSVRANLSQAQAGTLSAQTQQSLQTLQTDAAQLQGVVASLEKKVKAAQTQVPAQLQSRLSDLGGRLSDLGSRLTALEQRATAVLKDPSQSNASTLDASLATLDARVTKLLDRQVVQHPGELVLLSSGQLSGIQDIMGALRNLGFVLPLLALLLYLGALYLAKDWHREALIAAGGGILVAALIVLAARRLIGSAVVDSVASSATVKPAITSIWDIVSAGLRQRGLFVFVIGLAFIVAGLLAGPGRRMVSLRRFLSPYLRDKPALVYAVVAGVFLIWLAFTPTINNFGQVVVLIVLAVLAIVGIELLRRQTAREFPPRPNSS